VDRRAFIGTLAGGLLAAPLAVEAQPAGSMYRIVIVLAATPVAEMTEARDPLLRVLFLELRGLGYAEGQNLVVERRSGAGRRESYPAVAREVVRLAPDVIFAGSGRMAQALLEATTAIPIVTIPSDPVALGLGASLARPGGNVTGFSIDAGAEILGKRLELLKSAVPTASRFAFLTSQAAWEGVWGRLMREASQRAGITIFGAVLSDSLQEPEYRRAFTAIVKERTEALIVGDQAEFLGHEQLIVQLAAEARLPAIYSYRSFAAAGGLMAYALDAADVFRRAAGYIDRILKGANPGELPFQQPTKFELVINLKTAKALGLTIPASLLQRADQVIE
jgi:putative ABC transport system substrate-binding protein